jgi:hypothetical protein
MTPITPEALAELLAKVAPGAETWTVIAKSKHGYQVINEAGDAELGNWLIAECWWKEVAEFIALAPQLAADWLRLTADLSATLSANAALVTESARLVAQVEDLENQVEAWRFEAVHPGDEA